ncbi:inactive 1-aminocyclopropane-1-carboxylate synthase-like protein 2 [Biomphalaria glabrata]|nr:putative inactive 1-aminocyclopropane-1-carboxylate synthase-like protein 2 [Biomphalaria glabrata]
MTQSLSRRAEETLSTEMFLSPYFSLVRNNRFHPTHNRKGIVDLGLAENKLCARELEIKLSSIAREPEDQSLQFYDKSTGNIELKKSVKKFLETRFHAREELSLENLFITNGVTVILEALAFALAEPEDYIMVPSPYYYRINSDLFDRPRVHVLEVHLPYTQTKDSGCTYGHDVRAFEDALIKAKTEGKRVRALLLVNPHNPTGDVVTRQQLLDILDFAQRNDLHIIANEIYGLSVYEPDVNFTSILSLEHPDPDKVHFTWGFSKDFGLSGYRCAVLYTRHQLLCKYVGLTAIYFRANGLIQLRLKSMIDDEEWLDKTFFPTMKQRMLERYLLYKETLEKLDVNVHPSKATIFIWADFSKYLREKSFDNEKKLFESFLNAGVFILPGESCFSKDPGWFRIVAALDDDVNNEGLERLVQLLKSIKKDL